MVWFHDETADPRGETEDAHIHVSFNTNYGIPMMVNIQLTMLIPTIVTSDIVRGWWDHKTASLLAHEQGHFDITGGVREIHDALQYITGRSSR